MRETTKSNKPAFTLVELLIVISLVGILSTITVFINVSHNLQVGRDGKRKADLEALRSALEIYRSDNGRYPISLGGMPVGLTPDYISSLPTDPLLGRKYFYFPVGATRYTYSLCAALEIGSEPVSANCSAVGSCGGSSCNYEVVNP